MDEENEDAADVENVVGVLVVVAAKQSAGVTLLLSIQATMDTMAVVVDVVVAAVLHVLLLLFVAAAVRIVLCLVLV